jgi:hypothetical protein
MPAATAELSPLDESSTTSVSSLAAPGIANRVEDIGTIENPGKLMA